MLTESNWAQQHNTPYPVNDSLQATHDSYNAGASLMLKSVAKSGAGVVIASHNEDTMLMMAQELLNVGLKPENEMVDFATLFGMSDHASLALAQRGYNVCKYIPFGPVHDVMPYLMRRMQENRGFVGRTAEERQLMFEEIRKRVSL
jgi:proline dehydrogenase